MTMECSKNICSKFSSEYSVKTSTNLSRTNLVSTYNSFDFFRIDIIRYETDLTQSIDENTETSSLR